ncbi:hypothetical protein [Phaffia rhodozyma]|uniref:Uncharacterized protein n=1 Tax=Phaffia rhodozyma TaxID=264483 RepID=A0A0F7SX11_PHARH|nr:hypothetical protein [Phaffia rhodozyma]
MKTAKDVCVCAFWFGLVVDRGTRKGGQDLFEVFPAFHQFVLTIQWLLRKRRTKNRDRENRSDKRKREKHSHLPFEFHSILPLGSESKRREG